MAKQVIPRKLLGIIFLVAGAGLAFWGLQKSEGLTSELSSALTGSPTDNVMLLWPVLIIHGGMSGGIYVLALALMGERFKGASLAGANAAFILTYEMGAMIGPPLTGVAIWAADAPGLPLVFAAALLALMAATLAPRRQAMHEP